MNEEVVPMAEFLLEGILETAAREEGLVEPDEATRRILVGAIGSGLIIGQAYERTPKHLPWAQRIVLACAAVEAEERRQGFLPE